MHHPRYCLFVCSFVHSFTHSLIHSFVHVTCVFTPGTVPECTCPFDVLFVGGLIAIIVSVIMTIVMTALNVHVQLLVLLP